MSVEFVCGPDGNLNLRPGRVTVHRWVCPACEGRGDVPTLGVCLHCGGDGTTDDVEGWGEAGLFELPRPPAVMRMSCVDCAYRPGSPEEDAPLPNSNGGGVFYCHHGLWRVDQSEGGAGYIAPVMLGGEPVGAMVCAGWWSTVVEGRPRPAAPFRDPGGSDRSAAVGQAAQMTEV